MTPIPPIAFFSIFLLLAPPALSSPAQESQAEQVRTVIPYREGTVTLASDVQERVTKTRYRARGNVTIAYQDILITGDVAEYDEETREGSITGQTHFSQKEQWLTCSRAEFNFASETGAFYDASGYTDRQFWLTGRTILKTGKYTYKVEEGMVTACKEETPKWKFTAASAEVRVNGTARLRNTIFKIKGIPVFYAPYLVLPMEKKTRSSGFVTFHTGNSTSKGRVFSEGYYQTLGKSADVMVYGDYFSLRGLALGSRFRARPNPETRFSLEVYGIDDKLDQSGVQLTVDGESLLRDNWRAVSKVNISSNFSFRQAFADSFRSATISQERAVAFLTRNNNSIATNIAFQRDEVLFPVHSLVIRKLPSLEFLSLGTPLGGSALVLSFRTSLDGMSRVDTTMNADDLIQRLDFYPRLTVRIPEVKGFSLTPSIGLRETYYGAQLSEDSETGVTNRGLHRRYADLNLDLRLPVLERDFSSSWLGSFRHTVEPFVTYRWIHGIDDFEKVIRFDEQDAIADTSELEYGIINRFFRGRKNGAGFNERQEFMSLGLVQKYYFDADFSGAFHYNRSNAFYPLNTVTGFYQTGTPDTLAPLSAIFQFSPRNGIHNDIRTDLDIRRNQWRDASLSTLWQKGKFLVSGTYFRSRALEPGMLPSNHIQGQVGYGLPERGFTSSFTVSYNIRTGQWLNSNTRMGYMWNCCGVAVEFNQFDLDLRTESRFSFSFTLRGISSFGNLKRPESLF